MNEAEARAEHIDRALKASSHAAGEKYTPSDLSRSDSPSAAGSHSEGGFSSGPLTMAKRNPCILSSAMASPLKM